MSCTENGVKVKQRSEKLGKPYEHSDVSSCAGRRDCNESLKNQPKWAGALVTGHQNWSEK